MLQLFIQYFNLAQHNYSLYVANWKPISFFNKLGFDLWRGKNIKWNKGSREGIDQRDEIIRLRFLNDSAGCHFEHRLQRRCTEYLPFAPPYLFRLSPPTLCSQKWPQMNGINWLPFFQLLDMANNGAPDTGQVSPHFLPFSYRWTLTYKLQLTCNAAGLTLKQ